MNQNSATQYAQFKLKDVTAFTVNKVFGFKWELWVEAERRYVRENNWFQGASKKYNLGVSVNGVQGYLTVSNTQYANMLEAYSNEGKSDIIGRDFSVKTNGKEGMEIRYYINPNYPKQVEQTPIYDNTPTPSGYHEMQNLATEFGGTITSQAPTFTSQVPTQEVRVEDIPF
jgi:hypothetical protein